MDLYDLAVNGPARAAGNVLETGEQVAGVASRAGDRVLSQMDPTGMSALGNAGVGLYHAGAEAVDSAASTLAGAGRVASQAGHRVMSQMDPTGMRPVVDAAARTQEAASDLWSWIAD
ncbi:MAG: hypothetical protein H6709_01565 [Kofleriaceae bacterium]|nr:hypothetical protein [Kofleriaceae bacterium]MCB9570757.1 hypothetical protein [Kofleriaceae bacterium]